MLRPVDDQYTSFQHQTGNCYIIIILFRLYFHPLVLQVVTLHYFALHFFYIRHG